MADDLVLSVRQIGQYPPADNTQPGDVWLLQRGGMGGAYWSINASIAVGTALEMGGFLKLAPGSGLAWNGASLTWAGGLFTFSEPIEAPIIQAGEVFSQGVPVALQPWVEEALAIINANTVHSFNGRTGTIILDENDIRRAGGVTQNNPTHFTGMVTAPTPWDFRANSDQVATTAWVQGVIHELICSGSIVASINGRGGDVVLGPDDITLALTSVPGSYAYANSPPLGDVSGRIATTSFVDGMILEMQRWVEDQINAGLKPDLSPYALLNSPNFTGIPTAPTAVPGTTTGQLATTAFVQNAVASSVAGVASFNSRTGAVTLVTADITGAGGAPIASPTFTGTPAAPTAPTATSTTQLATTAFVHAAITAGAGVTTFNGRAGAVTLTTADVTGAGGAPLASPALTGTPTAPTAAPGTNTTQLATTAFVLANAVAGGVSSFMGRTGAVSLIAADVSAAGGALTASPTFTGTPLAPTAAPGTNNTQIATTAFVLANSSVGGVTSFNGRTGAITMITADVTAAGGAPVASPALTGVPTAPTAVTTSNDTTVATTAFVKAAIGAAGGVASFNTRTGAVTLSGADISGAGGALLVGPAFSGVPSAPTAAPGTNTTQLATTAFVLANSVPSFNGRTGAITLIGADLTGAGGALIASPTFTGTPNAPTPTAGTNNTQIATTAFVQAAIAGINPATYKQSDTPPTPVTNFWYDSIGGQLYVRYVDPSTSAQSWVIANSPQPQAPASGSRVLLASATVSTAVASVDFFQGFDGTYDELEVRVYDWQPATQNTYLELRCSQDGATFDTSTANYVYAIYLVSHNVTSSAGGSSTTGYIALSTVQDNVAGAGSYLVLRWRLGPGTPRSTCIYQSQNHSSTLVSAQFGAGTYLPNVLVKGLRFYSLAGNIARGTFKLYGIVK